MTWFSCDLDRYRHAIKEIDRQRDRGAAIIAASILEEHLDQAIRLRLTRDKTIEANFFSPRGAAGTFAAKIDLGFLLGLYPKDLHRELNIIRNIRNNFAHNMHPTSFKSQKDECAKLKATKGAHRSFKRFLETQIEDIQAIDISILRMSTNPRTQYIRAVQTLVLLLTARIMRDKAAQASEGEVIRLEILGRRRKREK